MRRELLDAGSAVVDNQTIAGACVGVGELEASYRLEPGVAIDPVGLLKPFDRLYHRLNLHLGLYL